MIKVTLIETVCPAPEDGEGDYCWEEAEATATDETFSFRELVRELEAYQWLSSSRKMAADCGVNDWVCAEADRDYRTGEFMERTIHFHRDNPDRVLKYWQKALRAAGLAE